MTAIDVASSTHTGCDSELRLKWAAWRLGLPQGPSQEQVTATFVRSLRRTGFEPPRALQEAFWLLVGGEDGVPRPLTGALEADLHDSLVGEVDDFARHFFEFEPESRRNRWVELSGAAECEPRLAHRLAHLAIALEVPGRAAAQAPGVAALRDDLLRLHILRPAESAAGRAAILYRARQESAQVERAARWILKHDTSAAAVAPALLEELAHWRSRPKRIAALGKRRLELIRTRQMAGRVWNKPLSPYFSLAMAAAIVGILAAIMAFDSASHRWGRHRTPADLQLLKTPLAETPGPPGDAEEQGREKIEAALEEIVASRRRQNLDHGSGPSTDVPFSGDQDEPVPPQDDAAQTTIAPDAKNKVEPAPAQPQELSDTDSTEEALKQIFPTTKEPSQRDSAPPSSKPQSEDSDNP